MTLVTKLPLASECSGLIILYNYSSGTKSLKHSKAISNTDPKLITLNIAPFTIQPCMMSTEEAGLTRLILYIT